MDDDTQQRVEYIALKIPFIVLEHALNLITEMDKENDVQYRKRLVNFMFEALTEKHIHFFCSESDEYNVYHEFVLYLDGWLWQITSSGPDEETAKLEMHKL